MINVMHLSAMIAGKKSEGVAAGLVAEDDGGEAEGWGDDDLGLDDEDGGDEFKDAEDDDGEGDGWAAEDDIELPPDLDLVASPKDTSAQGTDDGYFVAPVRGVPPTQHWCNNSSLPVDHVLAGNMESACRLLHDQVGVVDFSPYKQHFMSTFSRSRTMFSCVASTPSLPHHPLSNWKDAGPKTGLPAVGLKLADLVSRLQTAYQLTTSGKFTEAVTNFRSILLSIPLLVVETKAEEQEAQQLLTICTSYLVGLAMESKRKEHPKATVEDQVFQVISFITHTFIMLL